MQVTKEKNDKTLVVTVTGQLDTNTAPTLEADIMSDISGVSELRLEVKGLDYISSAGLRVLLITHKTMAAKGGKFIVLHPCDEVMEILDMTGFSSFLEIEE